METVGNMKLYTFEEVLDEQLGKKGTPRRDKHERSVEEAINAYHIGEAIKKARLEQNLTQEELGERIGVKKAQISRLEKGGNITFPTMARIFRALGVATASIDLGGNIGKIALW